MRMRNAFLAALAALLLASTASAMTTVTYEISGSGSIGGLGTTGWNYSITGGTAVIQFADGGSTGMIASGGMATLSNFTWSITGPMQTLTVLTGGGSQQFNVSAYGAGQTVATLSATASNGLNFGMVAAKLTANILCGSINNTFCNYIIPNSSTNTQSLTLSLNRLGNPNTALDILTFMNTVATNSTFFKGVYFNQASFTLTELERSPEIPATAPIPEPTAALLYAIGLGTVAVGVRRSRARRRPAARVLGVDRAS